MSLAGDAYSHISAHASQQWMAGITECGLVVLDLEGRIRSWNAGAARISGWSAEIVEGTPFENLLEDREGAKRFSQHDLPTVLENAECCREHSLQHPAGRSITVQLRTELLIDQNLPAGFGIVMTDLTSQRDAEARWHAAETRYQTLLNHATDAYFLHAHGGTIIDVNDRACQNLGYRREELIGKTPTEFAVRLTPDKLRDLTRRLDAGESVAYESVHRRRDGTTFPVDVQIRPFQLDGQRCAITLIRDITERRLEEQRRKENEDRYRLALNTVHLGTWRYDLQHSQISLDEQCRQHYGLTDEVMAVQQLIDRLHPQDADRFAALLAGTHDFQSPEHCPPLEHRVQLPGGMVRWLSVRWTVHFEQDGPAQRARCVVGTTMDITAARLSEVTLRGQSRIFEQIAKGDPLEDILEEISLLIEDQIPASACSILLLNESGDRLSPISRNSRLEIDWDRFHSIPVGPDSAPCGVAAYTRTTVITKDLSTLSDTSPYGRCRLEQGWRACWSVPIFAANDRSQQSGERPLIGILCIDRSETGGPDAASQVSLAAAAHLAGVAVGNSRAIQAIRDSETRYALISEITRSVTFSMSQDTGGRWSVDWSRPRFGMLSGYTQEELNELGWEILFHPDDRRKVHRSLERLLAGVTVREELRYVTKSGARMDVQLHARLLPSGTHPGKTTVIGGLTDITVHKSIERALRKSEEFLRRAQMMAHVGSWSFDPQTRTFDCSAEAAAIYGLAANQCNLSRWKQLIHPDDLQRVSAAFSATLAGEPFELEHRLIVASRTRWVSVKASAEWGADGTTAQIMGITQDVSSRRRLEEQLRHSQKMEAFGQLAGGVAHDFNNLLTVINGYSEMLLEGLSDRTSELGWASQIREAGERATALTRQLLMLSRRQFVEPRTLNLNDVIVRSESMLRRLIGEDILIQTFLDDRLPTVQADPGQIDQVLLNLAVNSRDAMPSGGKLTITTCQMTIPVGLAGLERLSDIPAGCYVELTVSDTGSGMTEEVRSRIFEPFFSTKGIGKGTGLGMATVYGIVRQHDGHISLESEPGLGTTFRILFPVSSSSTPDPCPRTTSVPIQRGSETILLAEDEPPVRHLVVSALESLGYTVLEADSGESAIRVASRHAGPLHLLITDVVMPAIGGIELATRLRLLHPGLQVLYMSGYSDDAVVRRGVFSGLVHFIQKPFTPGSLSRCVQQLLRPDSSVIPPSEDVQPGNVSVSH